jgi:hypothetical protein
LMALMPVIGDGAGAAWHGKRVRVWNHAGEEWEPYLRQALTEINRALPRKAPRFIYRSGGASCRAHRRSITVCSSETITAAGETTSVLHKHHLFRSRVVLRPFVEFTDPLIIVCHELSHAVAGVPESLVPDELCPFPEQYAKRAYKKHGR